MKFSLPGTPLFFIFLLRTFAYSNANSDVEFILPQPGDPMFSGIAPPSMAGLKNERQSNINYTLNAARLHQIRSELMYPFFDQGGNENMGDYQKNIKDNSPQITKHFDFILPFFGFGYNYTWVSIHGFLGFSDGPTISSSYPLKFPIDDYPAQSDPSFIGPFYSRCKIGELNGDEIGENARKSGVYYRLEPNLLTRTDQLGVELRERLIWDIREGIVGAEWFEPRHAIIVTWKNLTFNGGTIYARKTTNTFQMVLATDETRTYAIMNYKHLSWFTHTEAGGSSQDGSGGTPAFIGFNAGNGTRAFEYKPYSQGPKIRNIMSGGNVNGFPNRHIFRIDEKIMSGQCIAELYDVAAHFQQLSFAPESGNMMGGTIVNVTGPCFKKDMRINCRFNTIQVPGTVIDQNRATCVMPRIYITGYIDLHVQVEGSNDLLWTGKFFVETPFQAPEHVTFNNEILDVNPQQITVKWDYKNLTMDQNAPVSITLWGYRERTVNPEIVYIETLARDIPNSGEYSFSPTQFHNKRTPEFTDMEIGLVTVNLTNPNDPIGTIFQPILWSRPVPLAWYMWPQWTTRRGRWQEKLCEDWIVRDRLLKNFASDVPICPCTLDQAIADKGRFLPDQNCDKDGKVSNCYLHKGAIHCVLSAMPTQSGSGQQCCYDVHGFLMMTADQKWGGRPSRAHDLGQLPWNEANKVPSLSHYLHDVAPFFPCCTWLHEHSWWCMTFRFERRPSQNCVGYQPPAVATVFGDPHIYTYDNTQYTFNGKGEYVLTRANTDRHKFDVQGRFEQLANNYYGNVSATVLTAVAAKDNQSSVFEVRLRPKDAQWRYKLDVFVDQHRIFFDRFPQKVQSFRGVTVYTPTSIQNQSHVIALFESGAGVEVIENMGHLTTRVYLPMTFLNQTRGLFGNWSYIMEDDLALPEGSVPLIANINNLDAIHRQFGSHWAVDNTENDNRGSSLFYHESGKTSSNYADKNFRPIMQVDPSQILPLNVTIKPSEVEAFCGDSYQCKYDYSVTLNKEFAQWSKYYQSQFVQLRDRGLKAQTSCGALMTPIHGRKSNFFFTPGTEVQFDCDPDFVLVGERKRVCGANGEWNVPNTGEDHRTQSEWFNFKPTKTTRCIEKAEHESVAMAKTAGIILGILFIILLIAYICFICYRRMNERESPDAYYTAKEKGTKLGVPSTTGRLRSNSSPIMTKLEETKLKPKPKSDEKDTTNKETSEPPRQFQFQEAQPQQHLAFPSPSDSIKKFDPSESEISSDESSTFKSKERIRPEPLGQARSRKPISNYDGVYYTGEPLPNMPEIDFPDYPLPPSPILKGRGSDPPPALPKSKPPPPPIVDYEIEPYVSPTMRV